MATPCAGPEGMHINCALVPPHDELLNRTTNQNGLYALGTMENLNDFKMWPITLEVWCIINIFVE